MQSVHGDHGYDCQHAKYLVWDAQRKFLVCGCDSQVKKYDQDANHKEDEQSCPCDDFDYLLHICLVPVDYFLLFFVYIYNWWVFCPHILLVFELDVSVEDHQDVCDMLQEADHYDTHDIKKRRSVVVHTALGIACTHDENVTDYRVEILHDS
jgi:hypothetical protein